MQGGGAPGPRAGAPEEAGRVAFPPQAPIGARPRPGPLLLGGGISNAAASRMLARQGPAEGGGGGSPAAAPAPADGTDWAAFWADDRLNTARQVGEVGRIVPLVGICTGLAADVVNGGQDLFGPHWQYEAPITHSLLAFRGVVNTGNGAFGGLIYLAQQIQDGLIGSGVAAEFAVITAAIIEAGEAGKVPLDLFQEVLDFLIEVTALYNAAVAAPPSPEAEAWLQLGEGYLANVVTDFLNLILDSMDALTGGAAQGRILATIGGWLKTVGPIAKNFIMAAVGALVGQWNVRGGGLITSGRQKAVGTVDGAVARSAIGTFLGREGEDDALARAGWGLALIEFQNMKLGYQIGDAIVGEAVRTVGQHAAEAEELARVLLDGQEPFAAVQEAGLQVFADMRTRMAMLAQLEVFGTTGAEKTQAVVDGVHEATAMVDALSIEDVDIPEADLGEGWLADAGEAVLDVGGELAEGGIALVLDQARAGLDTARGLIHEALGEVLANADEIGLFLQLMSEVAADQIATMEVWLAEFEGRFAEAGNFEEMFEVFINEALGVAGIEAEFDFDDIRQAWADLGVWIDEMIDYASVRASGGMPSGEPDVEGMRETGTSLAGGPEGEPPPEGAPGAAAAASPA